MSAHSIEFLYPTDPPGPRALRIVLLLLAVSLALMAAVSVMDLGASDGSGNVPAHGFADRNP